MFQLPFVKGGRRGSWGAILYATAFIKRTTQFVRSLVQSILPSFSGYLSCPSWILCAQQWLTRSSSIFWASKGSLILCLSQRWGSLRWNVTVEGLQDFFDKFYRQPLMNCLVHPEKILYQTMSMKQYRTIISQRERFHKLWIGITFSADLGLYLSGTLHSFLCLFPLRPMPLIIGMFLLPLLYMVRMAFRPLRIILPIPSIVLPFSKFLTWNRTGLLTRAHPRISKEDLSTIRTPFHCHLQNSLQLSPL